MTTSRLFFHILESSPQNQSRLYFTVLMGLLVPIHENEFEFDV